MTLMMIRRNWVLKCSIIANLAVLLYMGVHVAVKSGPLEYTYEPQVKTTDLRSPVPSSAQDQMRTFVLDKSGSSGSNNNELLSEDKSAAVNSTNSTLVLFEDDDEQPPMTTAAAAVSLDETVLNDRTLEWLKMTLECKDKSYEPATKQRGEFWVLHNFVRADHGPLGCHETVTYTTHGDFTFMDNLVPLLEKWRNPVSVAIHAPGTDLNGTVNTIRYLRDCMHTDLVKMYATFHVFFSNKHIPKQIPNMKKLLHEAYNCSLPVPYNVEANTLYKTQKKLLYPVNVGRNIARESALTHFIFASDIELYPSPFLAERFLNMIARNKPPLNNTNPRVFPISIFEVERNQSVPNNKSELLSMLKRGVAIPFHKKVCAGCHNIPKGKEWMQTNETSYLDVFHIGKRIKQYIHWEPIFIGTNADPFYDERLSWEGKSDKMTQGYVLCVMDYDFMILNNAFLVHRPGIKTLTRDDRRARFAAKTNQLIRRIIFPELQVLYGTRKGCAV